MDGVNTNEIIKEFKQKKLLIIGDIILDQYSFGNTTKISPEAPVLVLKKSDERFVPGGAANVANNIASLGAKALLCGVVGTDIEKNILFDILKKNNIDTKLITADPTRPTTVKHRFMVGSQQLLRVDEESTQEVSRDITEKKLLSMIKTSIPEIDGIILSDYAKGLFSLSFTTEIIELAKKNKKIIVADIKPQNKFLFKGVDVITPNMKEAQEMSGMVDDENIVKKLHAFFKSHVVLTKGEEGIAVFNKDTKSLKNFPTKKIKVFDVSGAGDTVTAVMALALVSNLSLEDAAKMANYAASMVIQKIGTNPITTDELHSVLSDANNIDSIDMVPKLWGYEKWIENNDKYCSKLLSLKKGYQCSLHYHKIKDEMFIVLQGKIRLELGKEILYLGEGNFQRVPPNTPHRFRGLENAILIEVSTHHDDNDSYRIEESRKVDHE